MYKALIIGAGQIAGGYDEPCAKAVLTHAHAYQNNENIELLGFYDINFEQAQKMAQKWSVKAFQNPVEADIISICTPDFCHLSSLKIALQLNPKIIFLEKPLSNSLKEAEEIVEISKNVPVLVNFSRRFTPEFQKLAKRIKSGEFGKFRSGFGYYGKGYIHNGSHMRNLLNLFFGQIKTVTETGSFVDFSENDPTKSVTLTFDEGEFRMQGVNANDFTLFELDLIFEMGRIKILNSGYDLHIYKVVDNPKYKGYRILELCEEIHTSLDFAMENAVKNIVDYLRGSGDLISVPYLEEEKL